MKFSVLMSVYKNEQVEFFEQAMNSVLEQSERPDEIILIRDGQVSEALQASIDGYLADAKGGKYYESDIYDDSLNKETVKVFDKAFMNE